MALPFQSIVLLLSPERNFRREWPDLAEVRKVRTVMLAHKVLLSGAFSPVGSLMHLRLTVSYHLLQLLLKETRGVHIRDRKRTIVGKLRHWKAILRTVSR